MIPSKDLLSPFSFPLLSDRAVKIIHDCLVLWGGSILAAEAFWVIYQFMVMAPGCIVAEYGRLFPFPPLCNPNLGRHCGQIALRVAGCHGYWLPR